MKKEREAGIEGSPSLTHTYTHTQRQRKQSKERCATLPLTYVSKGEGTLHSLKPTENGMKTEKVGKRCVGLSSRRIACWKKKAARRHIKLSLSPSCLPISLLLLLIFVLFVCYCCYVVADVKQQ